MSMIRRVPHRGRLAARSQSQLSPIISAFLAVLLLAYCSLSLAATVCNHHRAHGPQAQLLSGPASVSELSRQEDNFEQELVLIHGLGASNAIWNGVVPYLSESCRVSLYELHGHGQTRPLQNTASGSLASVVAAFGRWLGEQGFINPHLVGHGLGGMIAMQYAFDNPHHVRSLTVIDTSARSLFDKQQKEHIARSLLQDYDHYIASRFIGISEIEKINEQAVDMALRTDSASLAALLLSSLDWDLAERMPQLNVPMLLIGSEAFLPEHGTEREYLEFYGYGGARAMAFRRIPGSGHYLMLENPTHMAESILFWIHSLDR